MSVNIIMVCDSTDLILGDDGDEIVYFTVCWNRASFVYRTKNMK